MLSEVGLSAGQSHAVEASLPVSPRPGWPAPVERQDRNVCKVCAVWYTNPIVCQTRLKDSAGASSPREKAAMENSRVDELRAEVSQLLKKQSEVLESRTFGAATDTEILEYEIRREVIQEICEQLANSTSV